MFLPEGMFERCKCSREISTFALLDGFPYGSEGACGGRERAHAPMGMICRSNGGIAPGVFGKDEATLSVSDRPPLLPKTFKIPAGAPIAQIEMTDAQKAGKSEEERFTVFHFRPRQAGSLSHQQKRNLIILEAHCGGNRFK